MPLEIDKRAANDRNRAELTDTVLNRAVFGFQQTAELVGVKGVDAMINILCQNECQEVLLL